MDRRIGMSGGRAAVSALVGIMTFAGAAVAEDEGWKGELAASLTAQTGTTDSIAATLDAATERSWEKDAVSARFTGTFGTTRSRPDGNDETTQNAQAIFGSWKHTIHERFFWDSGTELSRDGVQDRDVRFAVDTGPGYRVWEGDAADKNYFDLSTGVGYRFELFDDDTAPTDPNRGRKDRRNFADIVAAFEFKKELFDGKIEYTHTGSAKMPANDVNAYILTTEAIAGVPLTEAWSLRIAFFAEYQKTQPQRVNNTTTRTTIGLGYKF